MSNFVETVKGFYSQKYLKVYDRGKPVVLEVIKPYENLSFYIHGLNLEKAEELLQKEFVDEYKYQLRFAFNLENLVSLYGGLYLSDLQKFDEIPKCMAVDGENDFEATVNQLPNSVWESYKFYNKAEEGDWGKAYGLRITIEGQDTLIIRTTTDGDGCLEVFDAQGNNLASARTNYNAIAWRPMFQIRQYFLSGNKYPPELR
ncbi:hypothetical protein [Okeania sp. KiyG1]|uniref:hypothetical protein n=1 Tax=Okeania sp. KiyG1 TaxID=2720165 RepID=UPI00192238A1|nr:hypothetical protein [Okeania sp. KiyG1]GGA10792.1 hypothetical protein CYANOKiyG1_23750 [Okeania sp. KiyG1]